jgi:carbon storage regulator
MGMLVLSRKLDERIQITVPPSAVPQIIQLLIIEVRGDKVRIGLNADRSVMIHREEIQRIVDVEGQIEKPAPPPIASLVRIGDPLPGA